MKIYNTQEEINADILDGVLKHNGDIKITFNCVIEANIDARNINARNINAVNIDAWNIKYYATCIAYKSFKCRSVKGRRDNSIHMCLDRGIEYIKDKTKEVTFTVTEEQQVKIEEMLSHEQD